MLRKQSGLLLAMHQCIDLCIVALSFYLAYITKTNLPSHLSGLSIEHDYNFILVLALVSFHISLRLIGGYYQYRRQTLRQVISKVIKATITGTAGIVFLNYMMHLDSISRLFITIFCCYSLIGLSIFKIFLYRTLAKARSRNYNTRSILMVGSRQRALAFIKEVRKRKDSGYRIIGCVETNDQRDLIGDRIHGPVKIIGVMDDFKTILEEEAVDEVVFGVPLKKIEDVHKFIYYAEEMGKNVRVLPDFQIHKIKYYPQTAKINIEEFLDIPTLALTSVPKNSNALLFKSCIDYAGAFIGITLLAPVFLCIALLIKMSSKGPIFFSQERSGLNGRRFKVHKFRTMVVNAEALREQLAEENEMDGPVFKMKHDPRITWIGRILRKTSLDELPQLFNVLKGEMSLVGPRPPIPAEVEDYKLWQRRRLSMKPGLTCIWQVSGRNDISFEQWMSMDMEYIDNWSLGLDLKLLILTVREVTVGGGH
ncbi:sugar transferase [Desulforhopalus sp. 52FAK]